MQFSSIHDRIMSKNKKIFILVFIYRQEKERQTMTTFLTIATVIIFIAMLVCFIMSYYYYYRSYDNIRPFPTANSFKRFWNLININISLLPPKSFKMISISSTLFLIFLGLICILLFRY